MALQQQEQQQQQGGYLLVSEAGDVAIVSAASVWGACCDMSVKLYSLAMHLGPAVGGSCLQPADCAF
jgi:hypothetical protein